jgi:DNA-binding MarR family transcriptional regulator
VSNYERVSAELEAAAPVSGVSTSMLLDLTDPLRATLKLLLRQGSMTLTELATSLGIDLEQTPAIADLMVRAGFVRHEAIDADGSPVVRIVHARQSTRPDSAAAYWSQILSDS